MREIKFRQPIIRKGKFEYFHEWGFLSNGNFSSPTNDWVSQNKEYPSQQYTGLKDKNGKEIYEGDIGYYHYDSEYGGKVPNGKNLWEVRYEGDMYMLYRGEGDHARYTGDENCGDDPHYNNWEEFEIRGNIYENPELLK